MTDTKSISPFSREIKDHDGPNPYRFCPHCATPLRPIEKGGRMRMVCPACGFIHYRNPTVGVAAVIQAEGSILLGRRSPQSSYPGAWCIPCGHVEWDEDIREAAYRECLEETGLEVAVGDVLAVHSNFHNPAQHTVGIWFACEIRGGALQAGDDLDFVDWFPLEHPPRPLAFPTDRLVIEQLYQTILSTSRFLLPHRLKSGLRACVRLSACADRRFWRRKCP